MHVVIDTNVLVVVNGREWEETHPACVKACAQQIQQIQKQGIVVLDNQGLIFQEYRRQVSVDGRPSPGSEFLMWLMQNQYNSTWFDPVDITPTGTNEFAEFPADESLKAFDPSDRKFVAVALTHRAQPPILNAVDSDWKNFYPSLQKFGVKVEFLCPDFA